MTPIAGRPEFVSLWNLSQLIAEGFCKLSHPEHTDEGWSFYMVPSEGFALYYTEPWEDPPDIGEYFIVLETAITDTNQNLVEQRWQARKYMRDTWHNFRTSLNNTFERVIDPAFQTGGTKVTAGLARQGFGNKDPLAIITRLCQLYGKPSLNEVKQALLFLNQPIDQNQPVEVMLCVIKEV